jgi:hypothetical protein
MNEPFIFFGGDGSVLLFGLFIFYFYGFLHCGLLHPLNVKMICLFSQIKEFESIQLKSK